MREKTIEALRGMYMKGHLTDLDGATKLAVELGMVTEIEMKELENQWLHEWMKEVKEKSM